MKAKLIIVSTDGWQCHPDIVELLMRIAYQQPWFDKLAAQLIAEHKSYYFARIELAHAIKCLRIHLYRGNEIGLNASFRQVATVNPRSFPVVLNKVFFDTQFDQDWFGSLSEKVRFQILSYFLNDGFWRLTDATLPYRLLEQFFGAAKSDNVDIVHTVIEQRLLRGNFNDAEAWLAGDQSVRGLLTLATLHFLQNRNDEAVELFSAALKIRKKELGKRNYSIAGLYGYYFSLALLRSRSFTNLSLLKPCLSGCLPITLGESTHRCRVIRK